MLRIVLGTLLLVYSMFILKDHRLDEWGITVGLFGGMCLWWGIYKRRKLKRLEKAYAARRRAWGLPEYYYQATTPRETENGGIGWLGWMLIALPILLILLWLTSEKGSSPTTSCGGPPFSSVDEEKAYLACVAASQRDR